MERSDERVMLRLIHCCKPASICSSSFPSRLLGPLQWSTETMCAGTETATACSQILYRPPYPSQEHEGVSTIQPAAERAGKMTHQPISWSCAQDDSCEASHTHFICSPMSVCAIDCTVQGDVPSSPAGLLRSITRGAYTALRAEGPAFKVSYTQIYSQQIACVKNGTCWARAKC